MSAAASADQPLLLEDVRIGIVGAGVGGLSLALALRQMGFPAVTVFEAAAADAPLPDYAVELTANASRVLHALGLQHALRNRAWQPGFSYLRNRRSGFLLMQRPLGDFSETRYGAPSYLLSQSALVSLLRDACLEKGVCFEFNTRIIEVDPVKATLTTAEHTQHAFTAIIVANGHPSDLRGQISDAEAAAQPDLTIISASCAIRTEPDATLTWLDDDFFCTQYPLSEHRSDLLLVRAGARDAAGTPAADALRALLADSHHHLRRVLERLEQAEYQPVPAPALASHWYAGKVALLGDACHPLGGYQTQGACTAIEDAWVLAVMMERWEEAPADGFFEYQRFRKARISKLQQRMNSHLSEMIGGSRAENFRRNFRWSLTNRFLPELSMAQFDWLYGYDCIKGFS